MYEARDRLHHCNVSNDRRKEPDDSTEKNCKFQVGRRERFTGGCALLAVSSGWNAKR